MRSTSFGSLLCVALAAYLASPVSSAPTDAKNDLANEAAAFEQKTTPVIAGQPHQIRLSQPLESQAVEASDPQALCVERLAASSWVRGRLSSTVLGDNELELQYLPPLKQRLWGQEAYAISLNDSLVPNHFRWGRGLAAHPNLPYAVFTIGSTAFVYRHGAEWTRVLTLRDHAASSIEAVIFSPDGRRLGFTYGEDAGFQGDSPFTDTDGTYSRIIDFDRIIASSTDDDISVLVVGGTLQKTRDALLASLDDNLRTGAGWTESEVSQSEAAKIITQSLDQGMARASLRRDVALRRVLAGSLNKRSFSPDGRLVFLKTQLNNISVHDLSSSKRPLLHTLSHPPSDDEGYAGDGRWARRSRFHFNFDEEITWIGSSPNGSIVATISRDKTTILWNPLTGEKLLTLSGATDGGSGGRFSPDGTWIAVASSDGKIFVYSTTTGKALATLDGLDNTEGIAVSSDGSRLAVVAYGYGKDAQITEFETSTWTRTRTYIVPKKPAKPCPANGVCAAEGWHASSNLDAELYYIHGGKHLVFRSRRGISVLGEGEREVLRISARLDDTEAPSGSFSRSKLLISPDGKEIWSLDDDETFRVWNIDQAVEN